MSIGTLLTLDCEEFCSPCDCRIWFEQCYVRWRCAGSAVRVYANGVLVSQDSEGEIYRPQYGLWELFACNGDGCDPVLLDSVNVSGWLDQQCPPIFEGCCAGKDFKRHQVPSFVYDRRAEINNVDFREVIGFGGEQRGAFVENAWIREWIDFDFGGSYLMDLNPGDQCRFFPSEIYFDVLLRVQGQANGFQTRLEGIIASPTEYTCDFSVSVYSEVPLRVFFRPVNRRTLQESHQDRFEAVLDSSQVRKEWVNFSGPIVIEGSAPPFGNPQWACGSFETYRENSFLIPYAAYRMAEMDNGFLSDEGCELLTQWNTRTLSCDFGTFGIQQCNQHYFFMSSQAGTRNVFWTFPGVFGAGGSRTEGVSLIDFFLKTATFPSEKYLGAGLIDYV